MLALFISSVYKFVCFVLTVKSKLVFFDFDIVTYDIGEQISSLVFGFFDAFVTSVNFLGHLICVVGFRKIDNVHNDCENSS